jgi:hemerythrin-like domain-containing protein
MNALSTIDFRSPAAGFDQPLAMWQACHERVTRMTNLLARLHDHLATHPVDEEAGITATSVRRYFDEAAPRHHDDEDIDLFPAVLRGLAATGQTARAARVAAAIERLRQDHADMALLWASLREQLARVERGEAPGFDAALVARFIGGYRAHIELEEAEVGSAALEVLGAADLHALGQAMAARRGVDWNEISAGLRP